MSRELMFNDVINSKSIKEIYPMVEKINIIKISSDELFVEIIINNLNINKDNMYENNFDPDYLVDYHIVQLGKYFGYSFKKRFFEVINTDGKYIDGFLGSKSVKANKTDRNETR